MKALPFRERLAVCSWSLQPQNPETLIQQIQTLGIPRVQIALDPFRENPQAWGSFPDLCARHRIEIVSGMLATVGEDYTTMDSIRRTGGLVPDETWEQTWRNIQAMADIARWLGLRLVTFHAGFLPHDEQDPSFAKLLDRVRRVADLFGSRHIELGFETGQETAGTLVSFLRKVQRANVGVNFDPANIILYDQGNPIEALRALAPWLRQCHIKDANRTQVPGQWGDEVAVGSGQVNWSEFFKTLRNVQFGGYCSIEREAGNQRIQDIRTAREYIEKLGV